VEVDVFTRVALLLILAFAPRAAYAQAEPPVRTNWDIAGTTGLFAGYRPREDVGTGYQELWFQNVQGGITLGRYLTRHLKLELEATTTSGGNQYRARLVTAPGVPYPYPISSEVTTSVPSIAAAVTWQFRQNEWVHPFVQAGVTADFDRETVRTREQFVYGTPTPGAPPRRIVEERIEGPTTNRSLRAVLGGGAKLYVTPRTFVRTDGRWSFDRERQNVVARIGFGVDF
jgi:hypothetical protein